MGWDAEDAESARMNDPRTDREILADEGVREWSEESEPFLGNDMDDPAEWGGGSKVLFGPDEGVTIYIDEARDPDAWEKQIIRNATAALVQKQRTMNGIRWGLSRQEKDMTYSEKRHTMVAKIAELEETLRDAREALTALDRPDEPMYPIGRKPIIVFDFQYGSNGTGEVYTYVALRIPGGKWYFTGNGVPRGGITWGDMWTWIESHGRVVGKVRLATEFKDLDPS